MSSPVSGILAELKVTKTRPRAQTSALLSPNFDPNMDPMPSLPDPVIKDEDFTEERLKKSLEYVERSLKRSLTPRSDHFMTIFKEEIKSALLSESQEEKVCYLATVRLCERLVSAHKFLRLESEVSKAEKEMQSQLLQFRELQYHHRYSDYVKIIPLQLRFGSREHGTEGYAQLSGRHYWSSIAERLNRERSLLQNENQAGLVEPAQIPTLRAVGSACAALGIVESLAIWSILEYGRRNYLVHNDTKTLMSEGEYVRLAEVYHADYEDIEVVFSDLRSPTDKIALRVIIKEEILKWYDTSSDQDLENPRLWRPKPELFAVYAQAQQLKSKPTNAEAKDENKVKMMQLQKEKAERQQASSVAGKKRDASTEVPRGSEPELVQRRVEKLMEQKVKLEAQVSAIENKIKQAGRGDGM